MGKNKQKYRTNNYQAVAVAAPEVNPINRNQSPIKYILEQQKLRTRQDLLKLRLAIDSAENVTNFDRELLHNIYREVEKDPNLSSNWESRKMKVKEKPFKVVDAEGRENTELTKILESPWFFDWVDAALDSKKWGFSLIEFGPLINNEFVPFEVNGKLYDAITVIDRDNVKPELGIITYTPGESTGISFSDPRYSDYLMFIGKFRDRGFLWKAAKYILFKDNCLGNWSEWAEVFGMDVRIGKTRAQGNDRDRFIRAVRDIGSNAYAVIAETDSIDFKGTTRTDAYRVYHELVNYIDEQVAKLIFGQDVVSNNTGRVVGTVGENVANMYGDNDARFIEHLVNKRLFPFMENLGFRWGDHYFKWDTTEKLSLKDRAEIDAKIAKDMGKIHSDEYINQTYGTEVTAKPDVTREEITVEREDPAEVTERLRSMYAED
jgi:Mu-like prophage protein gp29